MERVPDISVDPEEAELRFARGSLRFHRSCVLNRSESLNGKRGINGNVDGRNDVSGMSVDLSLHCGSFIKISVLTNGNTLI